jgi:biofilm PGA synthesis N-glycosyltransferase PgaC
MTVADVVLVSLFVVVVGINTLVWGISGLTRALFERVGRRGRHSESQTTPILPSEVAVLIAAHDEALVIGSTLRSAGEHVEPHQIFVASDGSSDATAEIVRAFGAEVIELSPNRGKAAALVAAIEAFDLVERFQVIVLLDADTVLSPDYLSTGLAQFDSPDVVAVAGRASTRMTPAAPTRVGRVVVAYRERVYLVMQFLLKYGQAARAFDAVTIVPGFASLYRTSILDRIDITAQGMVIEDYNMTFEVHAKRLGRVAFHPRAAIAYTQDPATLHDYRKQVARWSLGFWQTVLRHRLAPSRFAAALALYVAEAVIGSCVLVLFLPVVAAAGAATALAADPGGGSPLAVEISILLPVPVLVVGVVLPDYLVTVLAALAMRRPIVLLYGLVFPLLRILDAAIFLRQLPRAVRRTSSGTWTSPSRRAVAAVRES